MVVVSPTETDHTIKVATREFTGDITLSIRDEYTKISHTPSATYTSTGSFKDVTFSYSFNEDCWYTLDMRDSNNVPVYRGKVFVTDQTLKKYDVLKDKYTYEGGNENQFMSI